MVSSTMLKLSACGRVRDSARTVGRGTREKLAQFGACARRLEVAAESVTSVDAMAAICDEYGAGPAMVTSASPTYGPMV